MTGTTVRGRRQRLLVAGAAAAASTIGAVALLGWALDAPVLTRLLPSLPPIAPNTAAAFVLLGAALWCVAPQEDTRSPRRQVGRFLALAVAVLAALVTAEHALGRDLGVDRLLFAKATETSGMGTPGRPALHAALALLAASLCLLLLDADRRHGYLPALALTPVLAVISVVALLGYLYGVAYLRDEHQGTGMSVYTATASLVLTAGILVARPDRPFVRAFSSPGPGGVLARGLAPVLVLLPFLIGLLRAAGEWAGLRDAAVGVTATTVGSLVLIVAVLARTVRVLDAADVAQRRLLDQLRDERDLTTALLHSLQGGVVVTDAWHRVTDVNPHWCELTGFTREELLGHTPPYPWWPPDAATAYAAGDRRFFSGEAHDEVERTYWRADGSELPVLVATTGVWGFDGRLRAYVSTCTDMTERNRAAAALTDYARQLEEANEGLAAANQFKTDLMSMLSHEIGQPLTSITCFTELLTSQWDDLTEQQRLEDVHRIETGARRLFELVGELMLMFRLDAHAILAGRVPVDVADAVRSAAARLAESVPVHSRAEPGLVALADAGHIQQVLVNLLTNAGKYGKPPVEVSTISAGGRVQIRVRDHGEGVPLEFVPKLFDRFTRAGTGVAATMQGSGLGLFIVRQLVEASGGSISYEPANPGACFVVELDRVTEPAPALAPQAS